jgi:hypothetical protein
MRRALGVILAFALLAYVPVASSEAEAGSRKVRCYRGSGATLRCDNHTPVIESHPGERDRPWGATYKVKARVEFKRGEPRVVHLFLPPGYSKRQKFDRPIKRVHVVKKTRIPWPIADDPRAPAINLVCDEDRNVTVDVEWPQRFGTSGVEAAVYASFSSPSGGWATSLGATPAADDKWVRGDEGARDGLTWRLGIPGRMSCNYVSYTYSFQIFFRAYNKRAPNNENSYSTDIVTYSEP